MLIWIKFMLPLCESFYCAKVFDFLSQFSYPWFTWLSHPSPTKKYFSLIFCPSNGCESNDSLVMIDTQIFLYNNTITFLIGEYLDYSIIIWLSDGRYCST